MLTIQDIPVYQAQISENEEGVLRVSLVDYPAVESDFMAFGAQRPVTMSAIADEEKRRVYGVLMRADLPICRRDESGDFFAETIRRMVEKYFVDGQQNNVNLMHAPALQVEGVNLVQLFIKDTAAGICPAGFEQIEDGSLFGEYHVTNENIWAAIKAGDYRGFSIEGKFSFTVSQQHFNPKNTAMSKLEKFKSGLAKLLVELGAATTDKGAIFWDGDEDLKAGVAVYIKENGERKPAPGGDYKTPDDKTIKVAEIVDPKVEVEGAAMSQGEGGEGGSESSTKPDPDPTKNEDEAGVDAWRKELADTKKRLEEMEKLLEKVVAALDAANVKLRVIEKAPAAAPAAQVQE